jgi:hypothetical protein
MGAVAPVVLLIALWWGSVPLAGDNDKLIFTQALTGFTCGIIFDLTILRRFMLSLYSLPMAAIFALEIFYSIMIYGFFMGFPVFNILVGLFGSYITAKKGIISKSNPDAVHRNIMHINIFSSGILLVLCICTAMLALNEESICQQVRGMLGLPFDVTMWMIWVLIFTGGGLLLLSQYVFSNLVASSVLKKYKPNMSI